MLLPDSDYAHPVSSFPYPVPVLDVDPDTGTLVSVCFNPAWLPYIRGCLKQLLLQSTWDTTDPDEINAMQSRAFQLIDQFNDEVCCVLQFRQVGCVLQSSTDGVTWVDIYDPTTCVTGITDGIIADGIATGQIASGLGQLGPMTEPALNTCQTFHVKLRANQMWRSPYPVAEGWSVHVTNVTGAWTDGTFSAWYCPDGSRYVLGGCLNIKQHLGGDPSATFWHMQLVALVNGVYFDPTSLYNVPTNTPPSDLFLQANDANIADDGGEIEFDLEICNFTKTWRHDFDFTGGNQHGWIVTPGTATVFTTFADGLHGFAAADNFGIQLTLPVGSAQATIGWLLTYASSFSRDQNFGETGGPCVYGPVATQSSQGWNLAPNPICLTDGQTIGFALFDASGVGIQRISFVGTGDDPFLGL